MSIIGPVDATVVPRYAGDTTFARLPRLADVPNADIAVWGVPFDGGVSYRPGARFGPNHVRQSSRLLRPYNPAQERSPFAEKQVVDAGDAAVNPFSLDEAIATIERDASQLLSQVDRVVTIGGDHTIVLPNLRAHHKVHGPLSVIHFDAHLDTWDTYFGAPYTHGTPFRRASEEGLIDRAHSMHVGLRGPLYSELDLSESAELGFEPLHCRDYVRQGIDEIISRIHRRVGDGPAYLSIDIDVLDPAFAPGTGTPESGGLSSAQLLETIRGLKGLNLVGAEIVEVAPAYDHAEITGIAAAHCAFEILTLL